ncbi:YqcC family protein [Pantoea sp. 18069]|uniref:YqcC family protein n=1 Tax=Pantoea sp. 18069 TaxID=2681415 RepID=UPI0013575FCF|nr:YqcC family protein [Pantoea sp. 18069]
MSLTAQHAEIQEQLQALQAEMSALDLWSALPPSAQALASTMPFMYDTLEFHQWLQWVLVPRLNALIDARSPLPGNCNTHALGEHEFSRLAPRDCSRLLAVLQRLDHALNTGAAKH